MASFVDIANLALSRLGDDASVSSLDPPEGSAQAEHCARFLPIARDEMLEMHAWGFATRRANNLAQLASPASTWQYAFALPSETLRVLAVLPADADDDLYGLSEATAWADRMPYYQSYSPVSYALESDADGNPIILTNTPNVSARIITRANDPTRYPPLFVVALSWKLASHLAGVVIKGEAGAQAAQMCEAAFLRAWARATASDGAQGRKDVTPLTPWITGR